MSRTILIVDDSKTERLILGAYLKTDYDLIEADSGQQAIDILRAQWSRVSAIVMDVVMPGLDGFETLRAIKANPQWLPIPVIITTGLDDEDSREKAVALGADSFVTKPFNRKLLLHVVGNAVQLREMAAMADQIMRDRLTGLLSRDSFFTEAERMIRRHEPGYYTLSCLDIENFKVINDQYGTESGDAVLCHIAQTLNGFVGDIKGLCGRYMADKFAVLYPTSMQNSPQIAANHIAATTPPCLQRPLRIRIGRYLVNDITIPVSAMFDRASMAEEMVKGRYDTYVGEYNEKMRDDLLREQQIVGDMVAALESGEFEPWFQPQYNHATGALIGAEALVRWRKEGRIIPPGDFIPVFEKNGFIYEVDKSVWRQVCAHLRRWLDAGQEPLPISVNISRYDLFQPDFMPSLCGLVDEFGLPIDLLRLEITESAFADSANVITEMVGRLIERGFTVEIDDFGSGYSSLNTLKDVPASILKLDLRFFETTQNSVRGGNIVESVVRMAKWLGMAVIAEGVEEQAQADYLKSIGCYYIQGYFYARPMPLESYEAAMASNVKEAKLSRLETLETLDSNLFWDPKSMETLVFNSYAGGACIFEAHDNSTELLRVNDQYVGEMHGLVPADAQLKDSSIVAFLDDEERETVRNTLLTAKQSGRPASCELRLSNGKQVEYIRYTARMIAQTNERRLYYAVIVNITEQREAEQKREEAARQLQVIMGNVNGSVSAFVMDEAGNTTPIFCNKKYYEIYGYTKQQADDIQLDMMSCILPEDFAVVVRKLNKLKQDGLPIDIDYRAKKRDGSVIFVRSIASRMSIDGYGDEVIVAVETDCTEQHTLQDQLRAVIENINGGVSVVQMRGDRSEFLLVNRAYFEIIGYSEEQFHAEINNAFDLVHADDRERVEKLLKEAATEQKHYTMEYRIVRRNGAIRYVLCNITVMYLFGVKEPVQLSVMNDVTLLREAQQKESDIAAQMQAIMQSINGGVSASVFYDEGHIEIAFANDGFYKLFGYSEQQFKAEVLNALDPILLEDRARITATVARIVAERGSDTYEYRCRKRDGSIIWIQTANTVISLTGVGDTVLLAVTSDVTELRRAQEQSLETTDRLSAVMNAMTSGVTAVIAQEQIQFLFANDCYYQLHGIAHESGTQDDLRQTFSMIHADDRQRIRDVVMSLTAVGQSAEAEYRVNLPDATLRYVKMQISVTKLVGVDPPVQVAIYTDVTEERKYGEQLRFLNESASQILAQPDSEKAIRDTLGKLLDYFAGERSYIFELDDDRQTSDNTYELCAAGVKPQIDWLKGVPYSTQQYWFDAFDKAGFVAIPDVTAIDESQAAMREILLAQNIGSIIVAPLWRDGRLIGYLAVDNPTKAVEQVSQLIALADYIAVLLTRRDLMNIVEHERRTVQQLMDDTPGGFLRMQLPAGKNPTVVSFNAGLCSMLNMSGEEIMAAYGDDAYKCLAPQDVAAVAKEAADGLSTRGQYAQKCRLKKQGGDYIWVQVFGRSVRGENGELFLNAYFTDITEQKKAEQLSIELLDKMPAGAALFEYDGKDLKIIHLNKRYWEMVGREAVDYSQASLGDAIHPGDRAPMVQEIESAIRHQRDAAGDFRLLCGDGSYHPFRITAKSEAQEGGGYLLYASYTPLYDGDASMRELLPAALDLAEQTKADDLRAQLLDNLPFGAALFSYDGEQLTAIHYNKQYRRIINSRWSGAASDIKPVSFIHPDDRPAVFDELKAAIAAGRNGSCEVRLLYSGQEYRGFRLDAHIVADGDGSYLLFVAYTPLTPQELSFKAMLPLMFEKIMESSTDLAFAKDLNFRYICCSKTFAQLVGLASEKDVVGKTDHELFPDEVADRFRRDDSALFATEKPLVDMQEVLPSPDGTAHYIRTTKHLLRSVSGEVIGIYCTGRDVTSVREAYAQLRLLTDSIPGGIATFRCMPGSIETIYVSDGICDLVGYAREEFAARNLSMLDFIFDADRPLLHEQIERLMAGETDLDFSVRARAKHGIKWINCVARATDHVGDVFSVSAVLTDVTAQQEEKESLRLANEEYRIATLHANRTICRYDIASRTLSMSSNAAQRLGLPERIAGVPYERVQLGSISEETKEAYVVFFEGIINGEKESTASFCELLSGGWRWLQVNATTVFNAEGKPFSAIISYIDVTEQREKEVIYSRWQNSIAERPKDSYTFFRCNLSRRSSYESWDGELLQLSFKAGRQSFDERTEEFIAQCVYVDDRERYRDFLRSDTMLAEYYRGHRSDRIEFRQSLPEGKTRWLRLSVDLVEYPDSPDVQAHLMYENIDEQKRAQQQIIERAETDPLTGVLNRATFAMRANCIMNEARLGTQHALLMLDLDGFKQVNDVFGHGAGDRALVEIADIMTHSSRKEDLVGRLGGDEFIIFLPDIGNETAAATKARQLCELICKDLGVNVRISASIGVAMFPQDGKGFEALYKVADEVLYRVKDSGKNGYAFSHDGPVPEAELLQQSQPTKPAAVPHSRRILIVDDSKIDMEILFGLFRKDFRVERATDGATALTKLRHYGTAISAVLLDLNMPGVDGYAVLEKMKQDEATRTIPVIVVSADEQQETALAVIRAGADDLVVKPVDPSVLRVRVEAAISRSENERMRAQSSYLSLRNAEVGSYQSALEHFGVMVVTLDWGKNEFHYSPSVGERLAGEYEGRIFWSALLSNMATDSQTAQQMQQLVHEVAEGRGRTGGSMTVKLKTAFGIFSLFELNVFKQVNDFGLTNKIIITLKELSPDR